MKSTRWADAEAQVWAAAMTKEGQTLNQMLVEMDGFGLNEGVIVFAATNRPDVLDPALLRPGRFDRQIVIGLPDVRGREAVLSVHAKNKPMDETVDSRSGKDDAGIFSCGSGKRAQ